MRKQAVSLENCDFFVPFGGLRFGVSLKHFDLVWMRKVAVPSGDVQNSATLWW